VSTSIILLVAYIKGQEYLRKFLIYQFPSVTLLISSCYFCEVLSKFFLTAQHFKILFNNNNNNKNNNKNSAVELCCRYLAHMYMGECLVALDCIADGIDHLNPDLITDIGTVFPTEQKSEQGGTLATTYITDGNDCHFFFLLSYFIFCF